MDLYYPGGSHGKTFFLILLVLYLYSFELIFSLPVNFSLPRVQRDGQLENQKVSEQIMARRGIIGGILHSKNLRTLKLRRTIYYPFAIILHNSKPVGHQVIQMLIL